MAEAVPARAQAPPPPAPRTVLLIHSYNVGYEWTDELTRGVRAGLEGHGAPIDLSVEFLDARRRGDELFPQMRALIEARYSEKKPAVIVACDDPALQFLLDHAPGPAGHGAGRVLRRQQRRRWPRGRRAAGSRASAK